jgi:capsular exopolysaccharide synthesis family protein
MTSRGKRRDPKPPPAITFREDPPAGAGARVAVIESLRDVKSVVGEEFRLLRAKLHALRGERNLRALAVVSALPGEGKSTVSLGLCTALAREPGKRILLVEADLRKPSISRSLDLPPAEGLSDWLNGSSLEVPVVLIESGGFFLLRAGEADLERPEDLSSERMHALVQAARKSFDMVILDATPILPVADSVLIQDLVEGLLLVVRSRMTPREAISDALDRVRPEKVLGVVLNDHREYRESYYSYGYHRYGMRQ